MKELPPYRPDIFQTMNRARNAVMMHWRRNNGAYHQKLIITPQQAQNILDAWRYGQYSRPDAKPPTLDDFMGRPIEVSDATVGVIVARDGTETPLSEFDALTAP